MIRKLLVIILLASVSFAGKAQIVKSIFSPLPKPVFSDRLAADATSPTIYSVRPVALLSANVSNGTQLGAGFGLGVQMNVWDAASQTYITKYAASLVGVLGTNGSALTGTGGLVLSIPGTNGLIGAGGGYDFTFKQPVILTGVVIKFN